MMWGGVGAVLTSWRPRPWYYVDNTCQSNLEVLLRYTYLNMSSNLLASVRVVPPRSGQTSYGLKGMTLLTIDVWLVASVIQMKLNCIFRTCSTSLTFKVVHCRWILDVNQPLFGIADKFYFLGHNDSQIREVRPDTCSSPTRSLQNGRCWKNPHHAFCESFATRWVWCLRAHPRTDDSYRKCASWWHIPRKVLDQRQQSSVCFSNWKSQKQCSQEKRQKRQDAKESPSACDGTGRGGARRTRDICSFAHSSCILSRNASPDRELASGPRMWNFLSTFKNEPLVSSAMVTWPGAVSVQRTALQIKKLFARLKKSPVRCPCSIDKKQCRRWRVRSVWIAPGRPWSITYPQRSWWKIHKVPQAFFAHQVHAWAWRKNLGHLTAKTFLRQLTKIWWRPQ